MESTEFWNIGNIHKIATILIGVSNLFLAIFILCKNSYERKRDKRFNSSKIILFDQNLKNLFSFFEETNLALIELNSQIDDPQKEEIISRIGDKIINVRYNFIDLLLAIDQKLYKKIKQLIDDYQGTLSETVFDNGINISHKPKFDEVILTPFVTLKSQVIKELLEYKG